MGLEEQLFKAVFRSSMMEIMELLPFSIDVNIKNKDGNTPIHVAVLCRDVFMVETLIRLKANIDIRNGEGLTVLSTAVLSGNIEMVETLLRLGAKHDAWNSNGDLPIHLAAWKGNPDIVQILLRESTVNNYNHNGFTPLHLAVLHNHISIVKILIEYCHTNIDMHDGCSGNTALILAVQQDCFSIVKLLLENKADFSRKNKEGKTFNEFAATNGMKCIASRYEKLLSKLNADPTQSISPRPLARKRKRHSDTSSESSSVNSASRFLTYKRNKCMDQPSTSSFPPELPVCTSSPETNTYELPVSNHEEYIGQINSPLLEPLIHKYRTLSDISNISFFQSDLSEHESERFSNRSNTGSTRSSLSETIIYKCEKYLNISNRSSPESSLAGSYTLQNAKRIRLR